MAKGFFTQGVAVLLEKPITLDSLTGVLGDFEIVGREEHGDSWPTSGPSLTLAFRPEVNGFVAVDLVGQTWPDGMGDPQHEASLFGAWSMGFFGPFTFPGNLRRAVQQAWHWPAAEAAVAQHSAFLRVRSSYVFGAAPDALAMPSDYDADREAAFVLDVARALLDIPGALCYFNPNGEVLLSREELSERLGHDAAEKLPPLDILSNVRLMNIDEQWALMDTVGMAQLDAPDHEACFTRGYDPVEVAAFLRNISLYRLQQGDVIRDDNTTDGPALLGGVLVPSRNHSPNRHAPRCAGYLRMEANHHAQSDFRRDHLERQGSAAGPSANENNSRLFERRNPPHDKSLHPTSRDIPIRQAPASHG